MIARILIGVSVTVFYLAVTPLTAAETVDLTDEDGVALDTQNASQRILSSTATMDYSTSGGIVNGDFENGDLTGWQIVGVTDNPVPFPVPGGIPATCGAVVNAGRAAVFANGGWVPDPRDLTATVSMTQTIIAQPGAILSFDYQFTGNRAWFNGGELPDWSVWKHVDYRITSSGPFEVSFSATATGKGSMMLEFATLWIDNVQIIPEPSTLAFLSVGAIGLLAYAWRRRQRRNG